MAPLAPSYSTSLATLAAETTCRGTRRRRAAGARGARSSPGTGAGVSSRMRRHWPLPILVAALFALASSSFAAAGETFPPGWRQGFTRSVAGRTLSYRWAYPGYAVSLLCRAVDATWAVEWEGGAGPRGRDRRAGELCLARRAELRPRAPPLLARARRASARRVRHRRRHGEPRLDGHGRGRRAPLDADDAHRQLRRAIRLHDAHRAPPAPGRGAAAPAPRARGGGQPGLRARVPGGRARGGARRRRGGGAEGRPADADRRGEPPRRGGSGRGRGRRPGGPPRDRGPRVHVRSRWRCPRPRRARSR